MFNVDEELHLDYVLAAANLKADVYGIEKVTDRTQIRELVNAVEVNTSPFITAIITNRLFFVGSSVCP